MINVKYIEAHADTEPRNWENYCMMFGILGLFLYPSLAYGFKLFMYEDYLFIKGFFWLLFALGAIPYGIRATMSIGILLSKRSLPAFGDGLSGIFFGAAAICWKLKKPVIAVCVGCFGMISGGNDLFQWRYQISPAREFFLAYDKHQTWEQAKEHVSNPSKYSSSKLEPYIQDALERAKQISEENIRQRNEILNQQNEILNQRNEIDRLNKIINDSNKILEDSMKKK